MQSIDRLWSKLRDKKYREEFVAAQARRAIPFQIRAMMREKGISQQELATRADLTQGVISRAANPTYGKLTLNTIIRVAAGFDVAFIGRFVPFTELTRYYDELAEAELARVPTFDDEDRQRSPKEDARVGSATGAEREASIGQQPCPRTEPWFRLTPPRQDRVPGTVHEFPKLPKSRVGHGSASAAESKAASQ